MRVTRPHRWLTGWVVLVVAAAGLASQNTAQAAAADPWMDTSLSAEERAALLLTQMTLEEKVALMTGDTPPAGQPLAFFNAGIPRLGIPELRMADIGPGVRFFSQAPGFDGPATTAFPMGIAAAATWRPELMGPVAEAVREEARSTRHNIVLGPNVDVARNPFWSRIGETFGEDPLVANQMAAEFVRSAQADGDMAVNLKHFNLYTQETNRRRGERTSNAVADERTAQEIYTRPWAGPVAQGLASAMCAYNRINGEHACESGYLLNQVLRNQLGFNGFVLTDYGASYPHTVDMIEDGVDLETGTIVAYGAFLLAAVNDGRVSVQLVDERVTNLLRVYFEYGIFDRPLPSTYQQVPIEEHGGLAREVEHEAITLLRNRDAILPLQAGRRQQTIAVVGEGATWAAQQCCAGAVTNPTYEITPLAGIEERVPNNVDIEYARGSDPPHPADLAPGPDAVPSSIFSQSSGVPGVRAQYWNNTTRSGAPALTRTDQRPAFDSGPIQEFAIHPDLELAPPGTRSALFTGRLTAPRTGSYRLSLSGFGTGRLVFDGRELVSFTNEIAPRAYLSAPVQLRAGQTYAFRLEYAATNVRDGLDPGSVRLGWIPPAGTLTPDVEEAVAAARSADVAVVVAGLWEGEARDRAELDLPTNQDELIDAVAKVNPNTVVVLQSGGPVTMPWINRTDGILQLYYGGQEQGRALADVLFGDVNPSGKLPISYPRSDAQPTAVLGVQNPLLQAEVIDVPLNEGVFVGYRGYARAGARLQYPFGHGLSYTTFRYANPSARILNDQVEVSFRLRNTGRLTGAEVAQVYAGTLPTDVSTPPKQLAGWAKIELAPGESRRVTVALACKSLSYWDPEANTDAGASEGAAQAANENSTDPVSENTDGRWVTPAGPVDLQIGSSSEDIRLTVPVNLRSGTCSEDSDLAMRVVAGATPRAASRP